VLLHLVDGIDSHGFLLLFGFRAHMLLFLLQGPAQAQNLRDSLAEAKSDIVVKVSSSLVGLIYLRLSTDTWENHMD